MREPAPIAPQRRRAMPVMAAVLFGACATLGLGPAFEAASAAIVVVDTNTDVNDGNVTTIAALLASRGADGRISLREAMLAANNTPNAGGPDEIRFAIGSGLQTIAPTTPLPLINDPVTLDATTQPGYTGNPVIQLDGSLATGSTACFDILTDNSTIRGFIIHSWDDEGLEIDVQTQPTANSNVIQNNWVGVDAAGNARPNADNGILVTDGALNNLIGGAGPNQGNVVCSSGGVGITIRIGASNTMVQGNRIGVAPDGVTPRGNASHGIEMLTNETNNLIGGVAAGAGNIIANNAGDGIRLASDSGNRNALLQNRIYANGGMAIDLAGNGVTNNDAGDADAGANDLQNYPVLTSVVTNGTQVTIVGTLNSMANTPFRLEFFTLPAGSGDANGHGEARTYVGSTTVTTSGVGNASFAPVLAVVVPRGDLITASATVDLGAGNFGSTSELATNVTARSNALIVDTISDAADGTTTSIAALLANKGADGRVSLREAILATNGSPNGAVPDTILFDVPGVGPHTIAPASALPSLSDAVVIDGASEPNFAGTPIVELNGTSAGAAANGLVFAAGSNGSTLRALVVNRFGRDGIAITSDTNVITGNFIGLDPGGTLDRGNLDDGLDITGDGNLIGGTTAATRNVISGNDGDGIVVEPSATGTVITGNQVGTRADGVTALANGATGVRIEGPSNRVGGLAANEGNVVAHNTLAGVGLTPGAGAGSAIVGNSIHSNGALGIDLGLDGITPNDAGDVDSGPNDLLNAPVLTSSVTDSGAITVIGSLNSAASTTYRIELFASPSADASGSGEGQRFIGFTNVTTDGDGNASFIVTLAAGVSAGEVVTATTYASGGNTSEFSNAVGVVPLALAIVKRAYRLDGTPIPTGSAVPRGLPLRFLLYVNNPGSPVTDMRVQDALDPGFAYLSGTIRYDVSAVSCPGGCTPAQEAVIYSAAAAGTPGSDGMDSDVVSYSAGTVRAGDPGAGNARLDVPAGRVWAVLFTVKMQ